MATMDKNREICRLLGIDWHETTSDSMVTIRCGVTERTWCSCGKQRCIVANPDFTTDAGTVRLIRELEKTR